MRPAREHCHRHADPERTVVGCGRIALVAGATGGISRVIARALADARAALVLNGLGKPDRIAAARGAIASDVGKRGNKRFASVEEIGAVVVLQTGDAAAPITGTAVLVGGGWTAH